MRIIVKNNDGSFEVMEITSAGYDDDITCIKDENGEYDRYSKTPVYGLYFTDTEKTWWYIPGLDINTCNRICEELFTRGFADLREFREYTNEEFLEKELKERGIIS